MGSGGRGQGQSVSWPHRLFGRRRCHLGQPYPCEAIEFLGEGHAVSIGVGFHRPVEIERHAGQDQVFVEGGRVAHGRTGSLGGGAVSCASPRETRYATSVSTSMARSSARARSRSCSSGVNATLTSCTVGKGGATTWAGGEAWGETRTGTRLRPGGFLGAAAMAVPFVDMGPERHRLFEEQIQFTGNAEIVLLSQVHDGVMQLFRQAE